MIHQIHRIKSLLIRPWERFSFFKLQLSMAALHGMLS